MTASRGFGITAGAVVLSLASSALAVDAQAPSCPSAVPLDGTTCSAPGACEYGGDAHGLCSTFAWCNGATWAVTSPEAGCGKNGPECAASFDALEGGVRCPLTDPSALCVYAEGVCSCPMPCLHGDSGVVDRQWVCRDWSGDPGCPTARPALNTACSQEGLTCAWGGCCWNVPLGPDEQCTNGSWTLHPLNTCACGIPQQCPFSELSDAAVVIEAGSEPANTPEPTSSGCSCELGESSGAPAALAVSLVILLSTRRRRARRAQ